MNRIKMILIVLIAAILQVTLIPRIKIIGVNPNLSLVLIASIAVGFGYFSGGITGLCLGLTEDILFSKIIGIKALIYFLMGFAVGNFEYRMNIRDYKTTMLFTGLLTIIDHVIEVLLGVVTSNVDWSYLLGPLFIELVLNLLLSYLVIKVLRKFLVFPNVRYY